MTKATLLNAAGMSRGELDAISPRLVPLIAHDRAGFGGAVAVVGLTTLLSLIFATPVRSLCQAIGLSGTISLTAAFAIHFAVGYTDLWHLTPVVIGAGSLILGLALVASSSRVAGNYKRGNERTGDSK